MLNTYEQGDIPFFELETIEIDWSKITATERERGNWEFSVPDRVSGRKIGFEVIKGFPEIGKNVIDQLKDPTPIQDCRLNGQISLREYDENDQNIGDIEIVTIVLQHNIYDEEIYGKYMNALAPVLEKIEESKK